MIVTSQGNKFTDDEFSEINETLRYKSLMNDYVYLFGRLWPYCGDNAETFISVWLNGRFCGTKEDDYEFADSDYDEPSSSIDLKVDNERNSGYAISDLPTRIDDRMKKALKDVLLNFGCNLDNSYLALGDSMINVDDLLNGRVNKQISDEDIKQMQQARNIHLMGQDEKRQALQGFRQNKNSIWQKKYNQTPSKTGAEWHNMMYQEGRETKKK